MTGSSFRYSRGGTARKLAFLLAWGALWLTACGSNQSLSATDTALAAVRRALDEGLYSQAQRQAATLETQLKATTNSLAYARALDLLVEALTQAGKAAEPNTLALGERALSFKEQLQADKLEVARSLDLVGEIHNERGEFDLAVRRYEAALRMRRLVLGSVHVTIADALDHLAVALIRLERFVEARNALDESAAIRSRLQNESVAHARTLEIVGLLNRYEGTYVKGLEALDRSLELHRRLAPHHPDLVSMLHLRGDLLWLNGRIEAGRRSWGDALSLAEASLGPQHPHLVPILRKLALAADAEGEFVKGRSLRERGLQIGEASVARCHPERSHLLNDLATSLMNAGEYPEAQQRYESAIELYKTCLGERHSLVATAIHNRGELAGKMGDFNEAARLHQTAIDLWSSSLGPNHPYVARAIDGLAEAHAKRGQYEKAEALYERALQIRRTAGGPNHPDVAWTLVSLANMLATAGDVQRAAAFASQAVDIYKRTGGSDEPDHLARALELHGSLVLRSGSPQSARPELAEALELRRRTFGAAHPLTAASLVQLARADFASGDRAMAVANTLAAEEMARNHLRFTIRYLPERLAMAYANARPRGLDLALSIVAIGSEPATTAQVFDSVIRSRGVVLDEMAARAHLIADAGPSAAPMTDQLHRARRRFANLVLRSLQPDGSVAASALDSARHSKEQAERAVADLSAAGRSELAQVNVGLSSVRASLPSGSALVSYVQYLRNTPSDVAGVGTLPTNTYIAFVVRAGSDRISVTDLGPSDSIERLVVDWRTQIMQLREEQQVRIAGRRLNERVWAPLAKELEGVSRVFIVPDGPLNLVNFAALPSGGGRYVIDDTSLLHYLSTERDLAMAPAATTTSHGLLAVGGPEFGVSSATRVSTTRSTECSTGTSLQFATLPSSAQEAAEIGRLWTSLGRTAATVLMGNAASEEAVRTGSVGRSVVHFATHGFFLGSGCQTTTAGTRAVGGLSVNKIESGVAAESPLALAGLAFAGANRGNASGDDDHENGILTAEEIAGLNLQGTQWAVLSACDTGIGQVQSGEGVFGLRRAFQIAGVKTVIMSLWSVEDQSTRQFMRDLYEVRLRDGMDTAETLRTASLRLLSSRRERRLSTHPFYWAAFVASGDWR